MIDAMVRKLDEYDTHGIGMKTITIGVMREVLLAGKEEQPKLTLNWIEDIGARMEELERRVAHLEAIYDFPLPEDKSPVVGVEEPEIKVYCNETGEIINDKEGHPYYKCRNCGEIWYAYKTRPECKGKPSPAVDTIQISRKVAKEWLQTSYLTRHDNPLVDEIRKALDGTK